MTGSRGERVPARAIGGALALALALAFASADAFTGAYASKKRQFRASMRSRVGVTALVPEAVPVEEEEEEEAVASNLVTSEWTWPQLSMMRTPVSRIITARVASVAARTGCESAVCRSRLCRRRGSRVGSSGVTREGGIVERIPARAVKCADLICGVGVDVDVDAD